MRTSMPGSGTPIVSPRGSATGLETFSPLSVVPYLTSGSRPSTAGSRPASDGLSGAEPQTARRSPRSPPASAAGESARAW